MAPLNEPIAIIGSGCRFPGGASSPSKLWDLLQNPRDVLTELPPNRFDVRGFYHPDSQFPGHANVKHSYLLEENVAQFDAQFFNIKAEEASAMDPQQRLLLETVYESLESGGLRMDELRGSDTGVYVGLMFGDYEALQFRDLQSIPTYHAIGTARSIVSNRISYFFDWHGPSFTVDTACSSSLVALHQAVQALRTGEVHVAVTAGSNLILGPEPFISESKLKMLSPDGRSRMWDEGANGYARGEGVAAVVLKTLSAALEAGDNIQCVIRETGVNQDGRSRGITMPSATAQAQLIRETYAKAGLDITKDRCQYFEAHGTGTPAGDPVEAEAVHNAFFGHKSPEDIDDESRLLVGSVKTVIGHTESTAGLAGVLKVVQAMNHGYIPPNLLLNRLNPDVIPFYKHLRIPQELTPWPAVQQGERRRASVNSFGFGGTNAHVILESMDMVQSDKPTASLCTPFLFSAQSKQSLLANLRAYADFLEQNPTTDPADLAWTLHARRARLPLRVSFPASSIEGLQAELKNAIDNLTLNSRSAATGSHKVRLLGVFTGQGAQYARMGADLIETSTFASDILKDLDNVLAELPETDRPKTTLRQELLAEASSSNVGKATVSQPLCTAVQIVLVELLRKAGVYFTTVVGHSSGEIAAAFAAGYLSAHDAIRIAYYRGFHSHLASGDNGALGAMLAVGTTLEDAQELCNDDEFKGKVNVAACNSPSSVTLSGDEQTISELATIFEDENKFVRRLKVDKAYHSHHMLRCSTAYLESIKNTTTKSSTTALDCTWVSSVHPGKPFDRSTNVDPSYWVENMVSPVLFRQAIEKAASSSIFDGAIEVGPHPALKGPASETLQAVNVEVPYTGLLQRNKDINQSISTAIGYLWTQLDNIAIDFDGYEHAMGVFSTHTFIPELPTYQWNHSQEYWHESTLSRNMRQRKHLVHPLLGDLSPQSSTSQLTWKNILRTKDLPWTHGHQVQGQRVFPAAGYVATALETAKFLAGDETVQLIEVEDLEIHQALVFDNDNEEAGIDIQFSVSHINQEDPGRISGHFTYEACIGSQGVFNLVASGGLSITLGEPKADTLPASSPRAPNMIDVPNDTFYKALSEMGYGYSGPFKAIFDLKRKLGKASGSLTITKSESDQDTLALHPAVLDAAFHGIILAMSYPRDGRLWSLHLPTNIRRIRVNPSLCGTSWSESPHAPFVATIGDLDDASGFQGDVEVHSSDGKFSAFQVEGLRVVPLTEATISDDKPLFYTTDWVDAEPNADIPGAYKATAEETELAYILERGCCFYLRQLEKEIPLDHPGREDKFHAAYLNFAAHTNKLCADGKHRYAKKEWLNDTLEDIMASTQAIAHLPEIRAMHVVGEQMPRAIRGETTMLEHLLMTGLLDEYYATALGMVQVTKVLADTVQQIARRHPNLKIMEVGAGTGGATRMILNRIGHEFSSYTFTDVSAGFFANAQTEFAAYRNQMTFSVLDLEQDMQSQGFAKHSYDVVVASLVLHATKSIEQTLQKVRSLLKPGGYLVFSEGTDLDLTRGTALFGCLPGWWLGIDEGRVLGPSVSESKWDSLLRKTGFSGIDTMTPTNEGFAYANSVMVSQATDDWVDFIREPLMAGSSLFTGSAIIKHLFIVGGTTFRISRLAQEINKLIGVFCEDITQVEKLDDLDHAAIGQDATVLVLQDLDQPVFQDISHERFDSLKKLFGSEKTIIWVSQNRLIDNPYANMTVGFARAAHWEVPDLRYHFIDFQDVHRMDGRTLTETILRLQVSGSVEDQIQRNTLWSVESELLIDSDGRQFVPRLRPFQEANDRYNSAWRDITKEVDPQVTPVAISKQKGRYLLREQPLLTDQGLASGREDSVRLKLSHSSYNAIKTPFGNAFVVLGTGVSDGAQYVGLVKSLASIADAAVSIPFSPSSHLGVDYIAMVTSHILLPLIMDSLGNDDTLVVHSAPVVLAELLTQHANSAGIKLVFTTASETEAEKRGWLQIHQYLRQSQVKLLLPRDITRFVDFTPMDGPLSLSSPITSVLPPHCHILNSLSMFTTVGKAMRTDSQFKAKASEMLEQALTATLSSLDTLQSESSVTSRIRLEELSIKDGSSDPLTVIEWNTASVPVTVQPIDVQFSPEKTYWLVGLTGDMGLSVADWMVRNGAKYLTITSRKPKIDKLWLEDTERNGAVVRILSSDVTDFDSLRETHREITSTMPPIAGVAQGAMVLNDVATRDMSLEQLNRTLRPKVEGSLNLDRLFRDEPLDFFVFFSSTAALTGSPGQANYCAANMFMSGLAQQRRRRGLPASVMELGAVLGTGYITREISDVGVQAVFGRGFLNLSESDVHQTFAEAVKSSRLDSGVQPHISTGLRVLPESIPNRAFWYKYPQFACMTLRETEDGASASNKEDGLSIKEQLTRATTKDEVQNIIIETFTADLRKMLQLSDDYEITPSVRTDELGLDSLVAVRIRSWFLNTYQVNIPALRILKGASIQELVDQALETIPESLTPNLSSDGQKSSSQSSSDNSSEQHETPPSSNPDSKDSSDNEADSKVKKQSDLPKEIQLTRYGRLSYTQSMFLFTHELLNDKTTLNNSGMLHIRGQLRVPDLKRAIEALGQRHEALRTAFFERDGQVIQAVMKSSNVSLEHKRIYSQQALLEEYELMRKHEYDLSTGKTMKTILLSYSPSDHYFLLGYHHIIFDRGSNDAFMVDLEQLYHGQQPGHEPLQYLDYSNEQFEQYASGQWRDAIGFWRREFSQIPDPLPLHRSRISERLPMKQYASHIHDFRISSKIAGAIRDVARKYRSTPFHLYLAAFKVLLYRFLGVEDVCIGFTDSCRREEHMHASIGPFLNTLPIRMAASAKESFGDAIVSARDKIMQVLTNTIPLEVVLNELQSGAARNSSHPPLAQALMNYAETNVQENQSLLGCKVALIQQHQAELSHDIAFTVVNNGSGDTRIWLNVQKALYSEDDLLVIAHGYEDILGEFVSKPNEPIGNEWKFRQPAVDKALAMGNGPEFESTWPSTLMHRFDELFPSISSKLAARDSDGNSMTYAALSQRIDVIATELLNKGVKPGSRVAVFQHPTVQWVACVLAILKIGAVYVPLDAATPVARLSLIVSDSQPAAVLVHKPTVSLVEGLHVTEGAFVINIDELSVQPTEPVTIRSEPHAPAIILYTSGSTGTPKGVILQHSSLAHEFAHCAVTYGLGQGDVVLQQSAWSFDLSVTQLFLALGVGATLHVVSHLVRADAGVIAEIIKSGVTVTYATPTEYKSWLRVEHQGLLHASSWGLALVAGEAVLEPLLQLFRNLDRHVLRLFNVYGPTETTCGSTKTELQYRIPNFYQGAIPVGRASANESFYIVDSNQTLLPCGQVGEVVIGGVGVAMGYLNNEERTATSFLPNPYANEVYSKHGWTTMYRTGDVGYLKQDGTLILKGRMGGDTEIKLNGVRIDLTDVEQTVVRAADGAIIDAGASLRVTSDGSFKFMVVHVILSTDMALHNRDVFLRDLLKNLPLPPTMCPSAIIAVDSLPRTVAGKLDRRAIATLPIPVKLPQGSGTSELSQAEVLMRNLWQEAIPEELAGLHDMNAESDFFAVGGNSMSLIEMQHKMKDHFNISVPLIKLFQGSTLRSMAGLLGVVETEEKLGLDWQKETALQPELAGLPNISQTQPPRHPPQVIVLTGATGFLGQHLLHTLLAQPQVKKVICIAARNLTNEKRAALSRTAKTEWHEGDLRLPRLGLTEEASSNIFKDVDAVVHNGADVSHLQTYVSLRPANVQSTEELVKLCLPRNIPFHFISTAGIAMYTNADTFPEASARDSPPPVDGMYGYAASKWVSEVYLENVHATYGLPVFIHRPSSIIRPEAQMEGDQIAADVLQNMLAYSRRLRIVPVGPGLNGTIDLVRPQTVTGMLANAVMEPAADGVVYLNECGDVVIDISRIKEYIAKDTSADVKEVPLNEWISHAQGAGLSNAMAAVFQGVCEGSKINFPRLITRNGSE
nr:beta-ketoacyl synthase domain-containing protein [Colletotrichum truncatum]KAF6788401.1 beta-ketoacyl synthase domain-containing protein [Colletotrichum truncatum]